MSVDERIEQAARQWQVPEADVRRIVDDAVRELRADLDAAMEALSDLCERAYDYPTDLDPAWEWLKSFTRAQGTLASLEGTGYGPADGVADARPGPRAPFPKENP